MRRIACAFAAAVLASASASLAAADTPRTPLLEYAAEVHYPTAEDEADSRRQLREIDFQLQQDPPPAHDCSHTLGAVRFASMLHKRAVNLAALGEDAASVQTLQQALDCSPRSWSLLLALAEELMYVGRYDDAYDSLARVRAIRHEPGAGSEILARLDFIAGRWVNASGWLKWAAADEIDNVRAAYWECFLWLAQRRAGSVHPELTNVDIAAVWPRPVLATLQGETTEAQLVDTIRDEPRETRRREMLVEALYYLGEEKLAQGDPALAQRYFAASVNLKVLNFIEHHMALAELAKMRR